MTPALGAADQVDVHAWLCGQHEGQLGYSSGQGPRRLVVRYAVCADRLVFRLPEYSSALGYAPNQPVTMHVAFRDPQGTGVSHLLVRGIASVVRDDSCADAEGDLDEQWPDGVATHVLALPITEMELVAPGADGAPAAGESQPEGAGASALVG